MTDPTLMISRYFDDDLSEEEFAEFSQWLAADIENARLFARRAMMEHHLCECEIAERVIDLNESISLPAVLSLESENVPPDDAFQRDLRSLEGPQQAAPDVTGPQASRRFPWRSVAAVLLPMMVAAGAWALLHKGLAPATLTASENAEWITDRPKTGEQLPSGLLEMRAGLVEVRLFSGASMIVEGPARFRIRSENAVILDTGQLTAVVPEAAHGFSVQTPSATVVDLGTEFGVGVEGGAATHLEVFRGKITAGPPHVSGRDDATRTLTVNQTADVTATLTVVATVPTGPSPFVRKEEFDARVAADQGSSYQRWLAYSYEVRRDPDIVAYYTFDNAAETPKRLVNKSYLSTAMDGIFGAGMQPFPAVGIRSDTVMAPATAPVSTAVAPGPSNVPSWVNGRWPQKGALAFQPEARSRIAMVSLADDPANFSGGAQTAKPFTIAAWISPAASGSIISKGPGLAEQYSIDIDRSGHVRAWIREPESDPDHPVVVIGNSVPLDGEKWLQVVMTYDPLARSVRLYLDGALVGEAIARSGLLAETAEPIRIGARLRPINAPFAKVHSPFVGAESSTFRGRIDELAIFRRAISAAEVREMYESGRPD